MLLGFQRQGCLGPGMGEDEAKEEVTRGKETE